MPFAYIMQNLTDGQAAKRPAWGGYVKKTVTTAEGSSTETYTLTFVKRNGTSFTYTWDGSAFVAPTTTVALDDEFLAAMLATDWTSGNAADFEASRSGNGDW